MTASTDRIQVKRMTAAELKTAVYAEIDRRSDEIIKIGRFILANPELGYREVKTSRFIRSLFDAEGLESESPFGLTGIRARIGSPKGVNIAVLSELDAVVSYGHPFSDPSDGAAHACGHNAQAASMMGVLYGLKNHMDLLGGAVTFFAVPAEEFIEFDYRASLATRSKIRYFGGKQQLIYEGAFDGIDMAMMVHSKAGCPGPEVFTGGTSLGFVAKHITVRGREAHAGAPHEGINALNAAVLAISAINANRETFRDGDSVRIHQIITKGGDIVNIVPSDVRLDMMVRGASAEAIADAAMKADRSFHGAAMAVGAAAEISDTPGYLPLHQDEAMTRLFEENAAGLVGEDQISRGMNMTGSTDIGDLSQLIPCIQPLMGGFTGTAHSSDFAVADEYTAYVLPAKIMAATVVDLLFNGAERAERIRSDFKARMAKDEYLACLDKYRITR